MVRVLTYNIHHGEGLDGRIDLPRQAAIMTSAAPDLVALQEVDRGTARAGGVDQLAELARLTGMAPYSARPSTSRAARTASGSCRACLFAA